MITQRLREETKSNHQFTEEVGKSKEIISRKLTLDEYIWLISKQYLIHKKLECQLGKISEIVNNTELDFNSRKKEKFFIKDMELLGLDFKGLNEPGIEFKITNLNEALGAMYVMEGSTLGGTVILETLKRNENLKHISEFNYYGCYGEEVRTKWKKFQDTLIAYSDTKQKENEIVEFAKKTFDYYTEVFQMN